MDIFSKKSSVESAEDAVATVNNNNQESSSIKWRLKGAWDVAKYNNKLSKWALKRQSHFGVESPMCVLGRMYWKSDGLPNDDSAESFACYSDKTSFLRDFSSLIWMTYRKGIAKFNGTHLHSDCGWGCMLRCGQMLLAQSLVCHVLNQHWSVSRDFKINAAHWQREIISWFLDDPRRPFSLHQLVDIGSMYGKKAGDWYGPATTAFILREAIKKQCSDQVLRHLSVYVAADGGVVCSEDLDACGNDENSQEINGNLTWSKSVLLIIPLRLGADRFNTAYVDHLKTALSLPSCVGIMGGRPKHSMYFVGWYQDSLIYLDPHYCHSAINTERAGEFSAQSFHCRWPKRIHFSNIDPSCAIGFHFRKRADFDEFVAAVSCVADCRDFGHAPVKLPLFTVFKKAPKSSEEHCKVFNCESSTLGSPTSPICKKDYVFL